MLVAASSSARYSEPNRIGDGAKRKIAVVTVSLSTSGSMPEARKGADLKRDPRFALHGPTFNLHIRRILLAANLHHMRAAARKLASHPAIFFYLCGSKRNMLGP